MHNNIILRLEILRKIIYFLSHNQLQSLYFYIKYLTSNKNVHELRKKEYFEQRYHSTIAKFQGIYQIDFHKISFDDLNDLYKYFQFYGKFQDASYLKKKLAQKYIKKKYNLGSFFLAIEAGIPSIDTEFLPIKLPKFLITKKQRSQFKLYSILTRERNSGSKDFETRDTEYSKFLKEKRILISGPVTLSDISYQVLQKFDVHITTNKYLDPSYVVPRGKGPMSVSYFNNYRVRDRTREVSFACEHLDWAIVRSEKGLKKISANLSKNSKTNLRVATHDYIFNFVDLMGLQRILLDLLYFQVTHVFISNFSFHTDVAADYDAIYKPKDISIDSQTIVSDLREHDAVGNFSFSKYLFHLGFITCDPIVESILTMSVEDYAKNLDKNFGVKDVC